jgi:Response regulators consisting of a CheY-like receiver domain and a winged-helix DNA-binding domain
MRVLVVEDDPKLLDSIRQGLKEHGFAVDVAPDGRLGLELALGADYDALILDVMLPGKSGLEILRELRVRHRATPVLILSARSAVEDRVRGLDLGADDYLPKPFSFQELVARLRAISRRPAAEPATTLTAGDLELDTVHRTVRRGNRDRAHFEGVRAPRVPHETEGGRPDAAMILDHVWDLDYDGGSNLVEVYINYLRKKVDQGPM